MILNLNLRLSRQWTPINEHFSRNVMLGVRKRLNLALAREGACLVKADFTQI